jgi:hypothetical protein
LTTGKNADAELTVSRHSDIPVLRSHSYLPCLSVQLEEYSPEELPWLPISLTKTFIYPIRKQLENIILVECKQELQVGYPKIEPRPALHLLSYAAF